MFSRDGATVRAVLVLLPPSETKRGGGDGPPLRLDRLAHPELNPLRAELVDELVKLAAEPAAARAALGLSAQQDAEVARNAEPADSRYAGTGSSAVSSPNSAEPTTSRRRARTAAAPRSEPTSSAS